MDGSSEVTGLVLDVMAPADSIAVGLPEHYRAESSSVCFVTTDDAINVISSDTCPVVLHRVVVPGH